MSDAEFSRPLPLERLARGAVDETIDADADERAALAARFDLLRLESLSAALRIAADGAEIVVSGRMRAVGAQRCVATLEPAPFVLDSDVSERFTTAGEGDSAHGDEFDLSALDAPEPLSGEVVDLGELAAQTLSLALDPHPRAPHAPPDASYAEPDTEVVSPFAKLAALKT